MTNGEKYKTAQERMEAFTKYCSDTASARCVCCGVINFYCFQEWLKLECDDKMTPSCPLCRIDNVICKFGRRRVKCLNCGYASVMLEPDAIAAHNRVAKAVKESEAK